MKKTYRFIGSLALGWLILSCTGSDRLTGPPSPTTASVTLSADTATLVPTATVQLTAQARDASGQQLQRWFVWTTSDSSKATVSPSGVVTAVAAGNATITATSEGKSAVAAITVAIAGASAVVVGTVSTEAFTGTVGTLANPPWTQQRTTGAVTRNGSGLGVGSVNAKELHAFWNADTFNNDQYSQVKIAGGLASNSQYAIVLVRASGVGDTGYNNYVFATDGGSGATHTDLSKNINGKQTILRNFATTFAAGDVMKIDVVGTLITCYKNGVSIGTFTDGSLASGSAGVGMYGSTVTIDDWEGGSLGGQVPAASVATVTVSPASASMAVGGTQQLTATMNDSAGNVLAGRTVTWSSSNTAVATVSLTGLVTAAGAGSATITATSEGKSGGAAISVGAARGAATVQTEAFTGTVGTLANPPWTQQRTTGAVTRNGSGVGIGSVNAKELHAFWNADTFNNDQYSQVKIAGGLASNSQYAIVLVRASGVGDAAYNNYVFATDGGSGASHTDLSKNINGKQTILRNFATTFAAGDVMKIDVVGTLITCYKNGVSIGTFTDGSLASGSAGVGMYGSTVTIDDWEGGSLGAQVPAAPVATVTVSPASASMAVGGTQQLTATMNDSAGNVLAGRTVTWSSSNTAVATVSSTGLVTAVAAGDPVTITATSETKTGASQITVTLVPVATVTVSPASAGLVVGATQQLTATTKDANGNVLAGRAIIWTSSNTAISTVSTSGLVTAVAAGNATITGTSEGKSGGAAITVVAAAPPTAVQTETFAGVSATLPNPPWTQQRTAGAVTRNGAGLGKGSVNGINLHAFWNAATFNNDQYSQVKIAGGLAPWGQYTIVTVRASGVGDAADNNYAFATDGGSGAGHTDLSKNINGKQTIFRNFATTFAAGDVMKIDIVGTLITCYKNGVSIGTYTDASLASGSPGVGMFGSTVTIDDWEGGSLGAQVPVIPVATVTVSPATASVVVGGTQQLTAQLNDSTGNVLTGRTVTWSSSNAAAATVSSSGLVTAAGAGSATITATSETKTGTSQITVTFVPVATVTVSPASAGLAVGGTQQLTAQLKDSNGNALTGRAVTWSSSNTAAATVSSTGLVTAIGAGPATITATSETKTGTSQITVTIAPVATVTVSPASATVVVGGMQQQLTATTKDANGNVLTGRTVTWGSSNTAAATVSSTGLVAAVGSGSATITATSEAKTGTSQITATTSTGVAGPLRVSTVNPRYFADPSGRIVYLTGSHYWKNVQDNGTTNPPPAFDFSAYLDFLQQHNHNFTRLWAWEHARGSPLTTVDMWFSPTIYERPGPGTALDQGLKFDVTRINPAYLTRLRQRVIDAGARGIYVSVMLFDGWSLEKKGGGNNPWLAHPFNAANNINGINGDPNGDQSGAEVHTLAVPAVTALQETYVKAVIDAVNDLDNVIYEISNESDVPGDSWQYHMIDVVRSYEATKAKQHPIGMTVPFPNGSNSDVLNSSADWVSMNGDLTNPSVANGSKVSLNDTDHLCGICGDVPWVWKNFTRGHNTLLMDGYDGSPGYTDPAYNPSDPKWEAIRTNMGYARSYALRIDLAHALPRGDLANSGYCLAVVGSEYLVFLPSGGSVTVNLAGVSGSRTVEWFNPSTGQATAGGTVTGGGTVTLTAPFSGMAAVYIHQ